MSNQNNKKQNISLIIGLSIPLAMILFVAIAINAPRWFNTIDPPQYDFLYMTGQYNSHVSYLVKDQRLIREERKVTEGQTQPVEHQLHFFIYDVSADFSREIPLEEAMGLQLDASLRSADGFSLQSGGRGGWFLFGYNRDYRSRYLVKDNYSKKLKLENQDPNYRYYWNIQFLGWLNE